MKKFSVLVSIFVFMFMSAAANAAANSFDGGDTVFDPQQNSFQGFIEIRKGKSLYVDYVKAAKNQPTVVLLNGLTYSTAQWDNFTRPLVARGVGVVRFDFEGMGETLLRYGPYNNVIPVEQQATDTNLLLKKMSLEGPYNLVGLSYGGGVAAAFAMLYPQEVKNLIMMAPFTQPVEGQDTWIKAQIWATRQMFPWNQSSDDELYDYFLHQIIYATYPQAEPIVLEHPFKLEAIFRLVQGIRKYSPLDYVSTLPKRSVHLMIGAQDQYIARPVLQAYWNKMPKSAHASIIVINNCEHKIPEAVPLFSAGWVYQIVKGNKDLFKGDEFTGYPFAGKAESGNIIVPVN